MDGKIRGLIRDYVKNYKISPSHALPTDFINDAKSVMVFFLPFDEEIIKSNNSLTAYL